MNYSLTFESYYNYGILLGEYSEIGIASEGALDNIKNFNTWLKKTLKDLWQKFTKMVSNVFKYVKNKIPESKKNLHAANAEKDSRIRDLENEIKNKEIHINNLEKQISDYLKEITELSKRANFANSLQLRKYDLEIKVASLEKEIESLKKENAKNKEIINKLNKIKSPLFSDKPEISSNDIHAYSNAIGDASQKIRIIATLLAEDFNNIITWASLDIDKLRDEARKISFDERINRLSPDALYLPSGRFYNDYTEFEIILNKLKELDYIRQSIDPEYIKTIGKNADKCKDAFETIEKLYQQLTQIADNMGKPATVEENGYREPKEKRELRKMISNGITTFTHLQKMYLELISYL